MEQFNTLAKIDSRYMGTRSTQSQEQAATQNFRIDLGAGSIRGIIIMPRLYIDGKDKGEFENYLVNPGCKHEIIFFMANETEEYINLFN